jgi:2,4-dienoyl-CoA reductase-like NADH-dependent reductase (Old Yellow Enzyme family)
MHVETLNDANSSKMSTMFRPVKLGGFSLRNRFVMAPMTRCFSPKGAPGSDVVEYYRRRAEGGVGLIITEGTFVPHPAASHDANIPNFHGEDALRGWKQVAVAVQAAGARIAPQLWHVGMLQKQQAKTVPQNYFEKPQISPSGYLNARTKTGEPMSLIDIEAVVTAFGDAAEAAYRLGFDGIELQGAHGYLIDQFLWADTNRRTDDYGGSIKARSRFAAEIVGECRRRTAANFPIIFRFSQWKQQDYSARLAHTPGELEALLDPIVVAGADIFHCSQRRYWAPEFLDSDRSLTGWTKALTGKPAIIVGSVGLYRDMSAAGFAIGATAAAADLGRLLEMYEADEFDLAAIGRAMVSNPNWCDIIRDGQWQEARPYSSDQLSQLV